MSRVYIGPVGSNDPNEWHLIGTLTEESYGFQPVQDSSVYEVYERMHFGRRTATVDFTMTDEAASLVRHWIACGLIKAQMRQDLDDLLNAFADRWGIQR